VIKPLFNFAVSEPVPNQINLISGQACLL